MWWWWGGVLPEVSHMTAVKKVENSHCQFLSLWQIKTSLRSKKVKRTKQVAYSGSSLTLFFFFVCLWASLVLVSDPLETIAEPIDVTYWHCTSSCLHENSKGAKLSLRVRDTQHSSRNWCQPPSCLTSNEGIVDSICWSRGKMIKAFLRSLCLCIQMFMPKNSFWHGLCDIC